MQTIILIDIDERPLPNSGGKKEKYVAKAKRFCAEVNIVGQETYWSAVAASVTLKYSVKMRTQLFNNESFVWTAGKLYKIINLGKTGDPSYILLNIAEHTDLGSIEAIREWINANAVI